MVVKEHEVKVFRWHYNVTKSATIVCLQDFIRQNAPDADFYIASNTESDMIILYTNMVVHSLLPNDYLVYDPYYNSFIVFKNLPGFIFKEDKKEEDYIIGMSGNYYIGENFQDMKTTFSYARHFSSKEEAQKIVDFLVNEFNIDKSCFEIMELEKN